MQATMCMMCIRLSQLQDLMEHWGAITDDMLSNRILGIRVEVIVHTKMMIDGR